MNLFGFVFGKMRVLEWPLSWKFMKVELVPWCETWYLNLYGCKWPLSRKRDFGPNAYKFDKWKGWTCPLIKYDMCNYFHLNSVKWKSWNDSWCENEILAYMLRSLINGKFELVPRWPLWNMICEPIWFCIW